MQTSPDAGVSQQSTEDVAQLAWVLDELRNSLQTAVRSLRRHAREAEEAVAASMDAPDGSQLRIARTHLHQSLGVLSMLDLVGPAQMLRAMEAATDRMVSSPELAVAESADKVERASFALVEYLEAVIAGRSVSAVALFPQYAEVQKLAAAERVHPADLWSHRWRWLDPRGAPAAQALSYGPEAKGKIDPALLSLIRTGDKGAAMTLAGVFAGLAAGQTSARPRVFWKIASAFMDTLRLGLVPADLYVKRVASKVLAQYGALAKGQADIPERLLLDLLFFCTQGALQDASAAPLLAAVRQSYGLGRYAPVHYDRAQFGLFDPALLAQARKRVASVKEIWSAVSGGETSKLKGIAEPFGALCEALVKLHPPSAPLAAALTETVEATARSGQAPQPELAMEVATSVLYLEAAFEDLDPSDVKLAERTGRLAERLSVVGKGGAAPPLESWMEDLFRRVSDRQTMGSVVGEMRASLASLERSLDQFFRNPDDSSVLRDVPQQLSHMRGVLSVLGLDQAGRALSRMRESVEQVIAAPPETGAASGTFELLAGNLGALGFMFDMLSYQPALAKKLFVFDDQAGELKPVMGRITEAEAADDSMLEADEPDNLAPVRTVAPVAKAAQPIVAQPAMDAPAPAGVAAASGTESVSLDRSTLAPQRVDEADVPASNFAATDWLPKQEGNAAGASEAQTQPLSAELPSFDFDLGLGGPAPAQAVPSEVVVAAAPAGPAGQAEIDNEMLEIFTEEAAEVVQSGIAAVQNLRTDGGNVEDATVLRRAFHTLKGSSRMVGLLEFGEAGWAMEQMFNALLADQKPVTAQVCDLSQAALEGFGQWAGEIAARKPQTWSAPPFRASADAMRNEGRYLALQQLAPVKEEAGPAPTAATPAGPAITRQPEVVPLPAAQPHRSAPAEMDLDAWGISDDVASFEPSRMPEQDVPAPPMEAPPVLGPFDADAFLVGELPAPPDALATAPAPAPGAATEAAEAATTSALAPADHDDDQYKRIGSLRISLGLYNIYLNEADERSRKLVIEASEWALEWQRPPGDSMVVLAHSLAGSSSTVGFTSLGGLARLMEHALLHVQSFPCGSEALGQCFHDAAQEISRLLHQFAAGFLREADPDIVARLQKVLDIQAPGDAGARTGQEPATESAPVLVSEEPPISEPPTVVPISHLRDDVDPEVFAVFEEEAVELLPQITSSLRQWISEPADQAHRSLVLRGLHTLKGGARLAGAMRLGELAHDMESDIEALDAQDLSKSQIEPLLKTFDLIVNHHERLSRAVADGVPTQEDMPAPAAAGSAPALVQRTMAVQPEAPASAPAAAALDTAAPAADVADVPKTISAAMTPVAGPVAQTPHTDAAQAGVAPPALVPASVSPVAPAAAIVIPMTRPVAKQVRVRSQLLDQLVGVAGEAMGTGARLEVNLGNLRASLADLSGNLERLRTQLRDIELSAEMQMQSRLALSRETAQGFDPLEFDRFTRVQELTRMMAESVNDVATIQRSLQRTIVATEDDLHAQARQTRELQRDLLRTRMVEFDGISERLHRVVRQAAGETGKEVRFELSGGAIEMDRGMLERMIPPFEHLLRNCVAHGIEDATQRIDSGKDPTGLVSISLEQDGNDVRIKVRDDGAGLNLARIRDKALAMGLIALGRDVTDAEAANLILMPGFSTASQVTELSGRGIGMDVVRSEINAIGGRIETSSQPGKGTLFKMVLPLTTAVTQIVMLRAGEVRVGVPAAMVELVHGATAEVIAQARTTGTLTLDGNQMPFYWAGALLHFTPASRETEAPSFPVMVLLSASQRVAIQVDEVLGHQEVVVKNLGTQLARLPGLTGVSALPSGDTILIYNPVALAAVYGERARRFAEEAQVKDEGGRTAAAARIAAAQAPLVLVVDDSITVRRVTQRLLQREGYRVALAADGLAALESLAQECPVVMLSDIEMPRMNGFELVEKVRQDGRWEGLPIVMISSRSAEKHREHARQLGADDFLGKPYGEEELMALIKKFATVTAAS